VGVNPRVKNTGSGKNITPTVNMKSGDQTTIKKRRREQALKPHQKIAVPQISTATNKATVINASKS